jgi:hypothetical protein
MTQLDEIKSKLAKAKEKQSERQATDLKLEIDDLKAELKLNSDREKAVVLLVKRHQTDLEDYAATLAETRQSQDALRAVGENPVDIISKLEAAVEELKAFIKKSSDDISSLEVEKQTKSRRIEELARKLAQSGRVVDPPAQTVARSLVTGYFTPDTYEKVAACGSADVKKLFDDCERMPGKLTAYSHDRNARALFLMAIAGRAKELGVDYGHVLDDNESQVVTRIMGALRAMSKQFDVGYVESLSARTRPSAFDNWTAFNIDARKQLATFLSPHPPDQPRHGRYGVVRPAGALPVQPAAPPANPVPKIESPKPPAPKPPAPEPAQPKDESKSLFRQIRDSGVTKKTAGKRVAVVAGQAEKNEPIRVALEEAFEFKRVRWYDREASTSLVESLKVGGVDLLICIPAWHAGFSEYAQRAKKSGVDVVIVTGGSNKGLICAKVAEHFGAHVVAAD